jgi:hypothetical protein
VPGGDRVEFIVGGVEDEGSTQTDSKADHATITGGVLLQRGDQLLEVLSNSAEVDALNARDGALTVRFSEYARGLAACEGIESQHDGTTRGQLIGVLGQLGPYAKNRGDEAYSARFEQ